MSHKNISTRPVVIINVIIIVLEIIAFLHDCKAFGLSMFTWYTIDSNILQLVISAVIVYYCLRGREIPDWITSLHFISAVGLTVTFLIAAFVLAPEGGIRYYFIDNVAPINHLIGPALSVISLLFLEKARKQSLRIVLWPAAVSLFYGAVCLILNACRLLDSPYFFLRVHDQPAGVIALWFGIIAVLCLGLALLYYLIKNKVGTWGLQGNV